MTFRPTESSPSAVFSMCNAASVCAAVSSVRPSVEAWGTMVRRVDSTDFIAFAYECNFEDNNMRVIPKLNLLLNDRRSVFANSQSVLNV